MLATAATARKRRRVGNIMGWSLADVFMGGVIYTRVALAMELTSAWLGLEPGRKFQLPLGLQLL
jgi:hypothetical protein